MIASLLLILLGLFLPTQLGLHFWPTWSYVYGLPIDYLSPTLYLTDLLLTATLLVNLHYFRPHRYFFLLAAINIVFSLQPLNSLFAWARLLLIYNLVVFISRQSLPGIKYLASALLASTFVISILALLQFISQSSLNSFAYFLGERRFDITTPGIARIDLAGIQLLRPYASFSHPNSLAGYLIVVILLFLLLKPSRISHKYASLFALLALVLTFSRAAISSLFFALIIPRRYLLKLSVFFFLLITSFTFIDLPLFSIFDHKSLTDRLFLAQQSFQIFLHRPLLGVGLNNFTLAQGYFKLGLHNSFIFLQPVHNLFLLLLVELGILPLVFLIYQLRHYRNYLPLVCRLSLILFAVILTGSIDHYWLTMPQNRLLLAVCLGLILNKQSRKLFPT